MQPHRDYFERIDIFLINNFIRKTLCHGIFVFNIFLNWLNTLFSSISICLFYKNLTVSSTSEYCSSFFCSKTNYLNDYKNNVVINKLYIYCSSKWTFLLPRIVFTLNSSDGRVHMGKNSPEQSHTLLQLFLEIHRRYYL